MIEMYHSEAKTRPMSSADIRARAEGIAKEHYGSTNWDRYGAPPNSPQTELITEEISLGWIVVEFKKLVCSTIIILGHDDLVGYMSKGPIYAYYSTDPDNNPAHYVVVTAAVAASEHAPLVATNNPWGNRDIQTFELFTKGVRGDRNNMTFKGILTVDPQKK